MFVKMDREIWTQGAGNLAKAEGNSGIDILVDPVQNSTWVTYLHFQIVGPTGMHFIHFYSQIYEKVP